MPTFKHKITGKIRSVPFYPTPISDHTLESSDPEALAVAAEIRKDDNRRRRELVREMRAAGWEEVLDNPRRSKMRGRKRNPLTAGLRSNPPCCLGGTYSIMHANPKGSHKTKFHKDGTVTYWSVYDQVWVPRARRVPNREYAAMSDAERSRVLKHLKQRRNPNKYVYYVVFGSKGRPQGSAPNQGAGFSTPKKAREWAWSNRYSNFFIKRYS